uniref:Uncharacterized protein n=1 Tax=Arundo donax TaxID=35708 RepID=A0A0A8YRS7_ARUDO
MTRFTMLVWPKKLESKCRLLTSAFSLPTLLVGSRLERFADQNI